MQTHAYQVMTHFFNFLKVRYFDTLNGLIFAVSLKGIGSTCIFKHILVGYLFLIFEQ